MVAGGNNNTVFIGLACFNRPEGLQHTISCMQAQTHDNWRMLISDNASDDPRVGEISRAAATADPRISYHRQEKNIGPAANFRFVAERADCPLFMWASDDDIWEPDYIKTLAGLLDGRPDCAMAFASIDNINCDGVSYRQYPGFSRFNSGDSRFDDARKFLAESEIMGKANLIYGLFRTDVVQSSIESFWDIADLEARGGDVVFLFGFIARHAIAGSDEVLLHKRINTAQKTFNLQYPEQAYFVPLGRYFSYARRHIAVAPDDGFSSLARKTLRRRLAGKYLSRMGIFSKR